MGKDNNVIIKKKPVQIAFEFDFEKDSDLHKEIDLIETAFMLPLREQKHATWGAELFALAKEELEYCPFTDEEAESNKTIKRKIYGKINGKVYESIQTLKFGGINSTHPKLVLQRQKSNIKKLNK